MQFTYDLVASVLLFFLIHQFYVQSKKRYSTELKDGAQAEGIQEFKNIKKILSTVLVPILIVVAIYSITSWIMHIANTENSAGLSLKNINNIFFEQFFTILIIADVILLLFSFFHTDEFHKVIRNSGFIISTILIRLSFLFGGLLNAALILAAIIFGLLIFVVYNKFESQLALTEAKTNGVYNIK